MVDVTQVLKLKKDTLINLIEQFELRKRQGLKSQSKKRIVRENYSSIMGQIKRQFEFDSKQKKSHR